MLSEKEIKNLIEVAKRIIKDSLEREEYGIANHNLGYLRALKNVLG